MSKRLTVVYSKDNLQVCMKIGEGASCGPFTLAEKFIQQIAEFYNDNLISLEEVQIHVQYFLSSPKLISKLPGIFSVYFTIYSLLPDLQINVSNKDRDENNIFFAFSKKTREYAFTLEEEGEHITLSHVFKYKYEAINFLNFLYNSQIISKERSELFTQSIGNSLLFDGDEITIQN